MAAEVVEDDVLTQAAALAFYTALSFAPILALFLWVMTSVADGVSAQLVTQVSTLFGPQAGDAVQLVIDNAEERPSVGSVAGIVGLVTLLFSATTAFAQLQTSLNLIWDVQGRAGNGLWLWLRKRLLSLGFVITLGFLLMATLGINAMLAALLENARKGFPGGGVLWFLVQAALLLAVFSALFAMAFRYLPDVRVPWREVRFGAFVTALLMVLGQNLIGLYLGRSDLGASYGAAGALVVLLVWVYYASAIFFVGAEITQVHARMHGEGLEAEPQAEPRDPAEKEKAAPRVRPEAGA